MLKIIALLERIRIRISQVRRHIGCSWGGSQTLNFHALSPWNQGASRSWHINLLINQEAPLSFGVQNFYWGFIA